MNREYLGELVGDKVVLIAEVMNRQQYLPKIPAQSEVDLIFDTSYPDIQPYLFRVSFAVQTTRVFKNKSRIVRANASLILVSGLTLNDVSAINCLRGENCAKNFSRNPCILISGNI